MNPITRAQAISNSLLQYFTGKPCKNGHVDFRFVSNYSCVECERQRSSENAKRWKQSNPDAYRAAQKRHREKNLDAIRAREKAYREKNKEAQRDKGLKFRKENPEYAKQWRQKNPGFFSDYHRSWRASNLEKVRRKSAKRRADRNNATPVWYGEFDKFVISEAMLLCEMRKVSTKIIWHLDHAIPLNAENASGLHCAENVQVIPAKLNLSKRNRLILTAVGEWVSHI